MSESQSAVVLSSYFDSGVLISINIYTLVYRFPFVPPDPIQNTQQKNVFCTSS